MPAQSANPASQFAKTVEIVPPATPKADAPPASSSPTPASIPAIELDLPIPGAPSSPADTLPIETAAISGLETTSLTGHATVDEPVLTSAKKESGQVEVVSRVSLTNVPAPAEPAPVATESGPFVTETMAELYLQQGHREEALRVYRALLEQRPGDSALAARVAAVESELAKPVVQEAKPVEPEATPASEAPAVPSAPTGPTIRQVLEIIALRRPGHRPPAIQENGAGPDQPAREAESRQPQRRDTLSTLFSAAGIAKADEAAALVLALAFTEVTNGAEVPRTILEGEPAHRASNELSLDTVFGGGRSSAGGPVSYDEFFAQRPSGPQPNPDPHDDVAHFTKWLEGLKRR
jgi:hypothetical protein